MKTIKEKLEKFSTERKAKKYGRSFEQQDFRDRIVRKINKEKKEGKSKEQLVKILEQEQGTVEYAENLISCGRILNKDLANKLIDSGNGEFVAKNIKSFKGVDHNAIAKKLIDSGNWHYVKRNLSNFESLTKENLKILEERERMEKERKDKLKEIGDKFLKFGIKYTIDEESLLLNIKGNIDEKIFPECYELGLFQYVEKIDGNLIVWKDLGNPKYGEYIYSNHNFIFENLRCVKGDLVIDGSFPHSHCNVEAEKLGVVDGNLKLDDSSLKAPLKKIGGNCDVLNGSLQASNLRYIGGDLYLYKYTAPMGSEDGWIYFPHLSYVKSVKLNGYKMGCNKGVQVGDNKVYGGVIYFIDPDDPQKKEKIEVITDFLSRKYNPVLYNSIPTNENYKTYIKSIYTYNDGGYDDGYDDGP